MLALSLQFASPAGAALSALALVPLTALALVLRQNDRVARLLGLTPAGSRGALPAALGVTGVCVLLGLAAAQPLLTTSQSRRIRAQSEILFVVDVSRSMAASGSAGSATRLARGRAAVRRLRSAVPEVPAGLSGLTDRVLPYLFATPDEEVFGETLRRSVAIDSPPPQELSTVATSFAALTALGRDGFFTGRAKTRTCVLVSDGESAPFSAGSVGGALGCRLVAVRISRPGERVFQPDGTPEANYRSTADAGSALERLAGAAGGQSFSETDLAAATTAIRAAAVVGPEGRSTRVTAERALAPLLAGAALLLSIGLAVFRGVTGTWGKETSVYHPASAP